MVHDLALALQQPAQPPIAEAPALRRQLLQPLAHRFIVDPAPLIVQRRMADAGSRVVGSVCGLPSAGQPLSAAPQASAVFPRMSLSAALSSIASASSFLSRRSSSSSTSSSRRASKTSNPPYLAFHL